MSTIKNFEVKANALRSLVANAVIIDNTNAEVRGAWSKSSFRTSLLTDRLADLLLTTDALLVLNELLNGEDA